jgi:hypothetical protein
VFSIFGGGEERRRVYHFGFPTKASTAWEIISAFASNAFVAETALLDWRLLANPKMATAEDSHLVLGLAAKAPPRFNYAATAVAYQSEDGSGFLQHPQRYEDELTLFTRRLCELDQLIGPDETWHLLNTSLTRALSHGQPTTRSVNGRTIFASPKIDYSAIQFGTTGATPITLDASRVVLSGQSRFLAKNHPGTAVVTPVLEVIPAELPWACGAEVDLRLRAPLTQNGLIVVTGEMLKGVVTFTLLDNTQKEALFRQVLAPNGETFELHIPLVEGSHVGHLVMQNWDATYGRAIVDSVVIHMPGGGKELATVELDQASQERDALLTQPAARQTEELRRALDRIAAMESSKFWKLRRVWFRLRRAVGLGEGE